MGKLGGARPNAGRPKGSKDKNTSLVREAIVMAAEKVGRDGKGKEGLVGYCCHLAENEPKAFATLIGRVMPLQVEGTGEDGEIVFKTVYEKK